MEIRPATPEDAPAISALIHSVAHYFTVHPQGLGAEAFLRGIAPQAVAGYITAPNFRYCVGRVEGQLAGVVAVRDNTHLYHLFVAPAFQGRGLSRTLWQHAREAAMAAGNFQRITVNATPYAQPLYTRFGFQPTGGRVERHGIAFVPMELCLDGAHAH